MTTAKQFTIKAEKSDFPRQKIKSSKDAADFIRQFYSDDIEIFESFFLLLLNRANTTIGYAKISQGGTVGTVVDVKLIAKYALDSLAQAVVLAHNHPSGMLVPSEQDKAITKKVQNALGLLEVSVLDHVILSSEGYYSFLDNGIL